MRGDVIEIRTRGGILLVGGAGTLSDLSADLRGRSPGASAIRRLAGDTQAIHHLRHFWLRRSHPQPIGLASERGLLDTIATAAAHGDVDVVVLPSHHARPRSAEPPPGAAAPTAARVTIRAGIAAGGGAGPPGSPRPLTIRPSAAPPSAPAVNRMALDERLAEVLQRAAGRLPGALGDELLSLVTPGSIAVAIGLAAFGAAANLTPFGWAGDAILAAVAFGFGGLAAVRALGDLVTCFRRVFDAQSERDLDEAADALARAASAITVAGLAAILHQRAKRGGGGGGGEAPVEEAPAPRRSRGAAGAGEERPAEPGPEAAAEAPEGGTGGAGIENPKWTKSRPAYGKGQVQDVWNKAKDENGDVYDPNTGEKLEWDTFRSRAGQWDMGHIPGHEYRNLYDDYASGRITEEDFLQQYRDPDNYRPESVSANRSHQHEQK